MSETTNHQDSQMTESQMKEMRHKTQAFFKDQLPLLRLQCEFEELKAKIETARFEALEARIKYLQLSDGIKNATENSSEDPEKLSKKE